MRRESVFISLDIIQTGERIHHIMNEKGYSVSKLAEILQVSRQNVNQIKKRAEKKLREKLS